MEEIERRLYKKNISERNKEIILDFIKKRSQEGISVRRLAKYENVLSELAKFVKVDLDKVTEKELREFIGWLDNESNLKEWTKISYKASEDVQIYPDEQKES